VIASQTTDGKGEMTKERKMMARLETGKRAVQSKSVQGNLVALVGVIASGFELAGKLPIGGAGLAMTGAGILWSLVGALTRQLKITKIL
jgi:hypothetical protein